MEWIELVVHTTTEGTDSVSDILMESGASGTMIEDRSDIPDPAKPHGIWEIVDPKLIESMPEDALPGSLREAAELRMNHPDATLSELAEMAGIQKSGMNHRLARLIRMAEELEK